MASELKIKASKAILRYIYQVLTILYKNIFFALNYKNIIIKFYVELNLNFYIVKENYCRKLLLRCKFL